MKEFLRGEPSFDAIFAADDESAWGAMTTLRVAGRRVPEDVAVVGFDDVLLSHHLTPALTTVHAPVQEAGRLAATLLMEAIKQQPRAAVHKVLLPAHLVARCSYGCSRPNSATAAAPALLQRAAL